jgi:hypothetical protein
MNTKLTLSINAQLIAQAKAYAKEKNVSLSFLFENYLKKITTDFKPEKPKKSSIVEELSGIISLDSGFDHKEIYGDYLTEKYN